MPTFPRRRKSSLLKRILIYSIILYAIFNAGDIGRFFYPMPYREIILKEADLYNLDPCLLAAIIKTESNFNHGAVSVRGALGLMQLMPETGEWAAKQMGLKNYSREKLFEPATNIHIGSWYVANLLKGFNGSTAMMLASYNGGQGNVKKWLQQDQWSGQFESVDQIPFPETREFVKKVQRYRQIYSRLYQNSE